MANALRTDPGALRRVSAQRPEEVALGSLQRRLDWLGEDRHRMESRLRSELWEFYPEFEAMATGLKVGLATEWVLTLLERLPRPGAVRADERRRWDALVDAYHCLGFRQFAGRGLRHVAVWEGHWLALLGWQSAPRSSARRGIAGWVGTVRCSSVACT